MPNIAKSHRLRSGRFSEHGRVYFVTSKVNHRERVFTDFWLGRILVREMKQAHDQGLVCSLAWVIMPDHFHWLFELNKGSLADVIRQVKSKSAIAINKRRETDGRFWQTGFHETAMRYDKDLQGFSQYIAANPIRAGLVKHIGDYPLWDAKWL